MANMWMSAWGAAFILTLATVGSAVAQTESPSPDTTTEPVVEASPAPEEDAGKAAFLSLSLAERRAAQDALIWLNFYNGFVDGNFARRTREAIRAYQGARNLRADGALTREEFFLLKADAEKARASVGFLIFDEPVTGIRIGAPTRLLEKKTVDKGSFVWTSADGGLRLELSAPSGPGASLESIYQSLNADMPGRRIFCRAYRPGAFFVMSMEEGGRRVYVRYTQSGAGAVRGFSFAYPAAHAAEFNRLSVAVASSFDPFAGPGQAPLVTGSLGPKLEPSPLPGANLSPVPGASPAPSATPTSGAAPAPSASPASGASPAPSATPASSASPAPGATPAQSAGPAPSPVPSPSAAPAPKATTAAVAPPAAPKLVATAIIAAAGIAVTAMAPTECAQPIIGSGGVDYLSYDPASGLAVLGGDIPLRDGPLALAKAAPESAFVLSLAAGADEKSPKLEISDASPQATAGGGLSYVASLGPAARGAPVFDRHGSLVALIGPASASGHAAGPEPRRAIAGPTLASVLGATAAPKGDAFGASEIAKQLRSRIVGVYCAP